MRLLYYAFSYLDTDIANILISKGIGIQTIDRKFKDNNHDDSFVEWFEKNVDTSCFDCCFSVDYWPVVSELCQKHGLLYIAWSYDTPPNVKNIERTLGNDVNRVFWFDRTQYRQYKDEGFDNVYHMPLGVNRVRMEALKASPQQHAKYDTDISLVGKLYDSDYQFLLSVMPEAYRSFFETLVDTQGKLFDRYIIDQMVTDRMAAEITACIAKDHPELKLTVPREALTYAAASEVTKRERIILLTLCGKRYATRLYSYQDNEIIQNVERMPAVDYLTEMPYVFQCSKINLNPAFCMIESGASLRALDILGAGGFLLTRHQQELTEMFKDGEEIVVYKDFGDAIDKVGYYMRNEEEREKIALNGRRKALEQHSLQQRLDEILKIAFGG